TPARVGGPVSLYNTTVSEQIGYIASHCDAIVAFVEDTGALDRFEEGRYRLNALKHIILIYGGAPGTVGWKRLRERSSAESARDPAWFHGAANEIQPTDLARLIYTSGLTGPPKGVMDSYRPVLWMSGIGLQHLHGVASRVGSADTAFP